MKIVMKRIIKTLLLCVAFLSPIAYAATTAESIMVDNVVARATPPGQKQSAIYLTLYNTSDKWHQLVNVTSPEAAQIQLHTTVEKEGVYSMKRLETIDLPPKKAVKLVPGATHIMVIGLSNPLREGDNIPITLIFEDGSHLQLLANIKTMTGDNKHTGH